MERLHRSNSMPLSPVTRSRQKRNFRRNTLAALAICLIILGFVATPTHHHDVSTEKELRRQSAAYTGNSAEGVLQRMQHHTLTVEECVGTKCSTEVVNVHDTAMLDEQARLTSLNPQSTNASDLRLGSVTIKKQVGKPLVVTVRQDDSDPGQQVKSGGALLTDEAKSRVASHNQAASSQALNPDDPQGVQKTAQVAEDLSKNGAAGLREGDNVLDIHRDDLELSPNAVNPISLSSHTNITDANSLEIMRNTNSSSLLSGFNSEQARSETAEQQQQQQQQQQQHQEIDVAEGEAQRFTGIRLGTAMRQLLSQQLQ